MNQENSTVEKKRSTLTPPDKMVSDEPREPQPDIPVTITKISDLQQMDIDELNNQARHYGIKNIASLTKSQMVFEIVKIKSERPDEMLVGEGVLEVLPDGFGFLRSPTYNYCPSAEDIYVSPAQIRRFDLKKGTPSLEPSAPLKKRKNILLS